MAMLLITKWYKSKINRGILRGHDDWRRQKHLVHCFKWQKNFIISSGKKGLVKKYQNMTLPHLPTTSHNQGQWERLWPVQSSHRARSSSRLRFFRQWPLHSPTSGKRTSMILTYFDRLKVAIYIIELYGSLRVSCCKLPGGQSFYCPHLDTSWYNNPIEFSLAIHVAM